MGSMQSFLFTTMCSFPAVLIAITVQGYAKAKMADKLGDKLPRFQGRVTLNPSAHLDIMGFILLLVAGFGWTKPIETNPSAYKRGYKDSIKVSVAPILGNLLTAIIFAVIYVLVVTFLLPLLPVTAAYVLKLMLYYIVWVNISLMIFHLLPLPGLCGWNILKDLKPKLFYKIANTIYQYQMFILLGVVLIGGRILVVPVRIVFDTLINSIVFILNIFI
ncbi:MAG: site-2 protease family protein [Clostridium sp.]